METYISFTQGALPRIEAVFADSAGTRMDPTNVIFKWKAQYTNTTSTRTHSGLTNPLTDIVRESAGVYYVHVDTTGLPGQMWWYWYSTGAGQASAQGTFDVKVPVPNT